MKASAIFILLFLSITLTLGARDESVLKAKWAAWKGTNKKTYKTNDEDTRRFSTFKNNVDFVNKHNELFKAGKVNYDMAVNEHADMTDQEFKTKRTGLKFTKNDLQKIKKIAVNTSALSNLSVPPKALSWSWSLDWATFGFVSPVKNQGSCGSCWAFAVAAAIESRFLIKGMGLKDLSEQQLVDCDTQQWGCSGGWPQSDIEYVRQTGITNEANYPYVAYKKACGVTSAFPKSYINGQYVGYFNGNEETMKQWVLYGPLVVLVYATSNFSYYRSGVFTDYSCPALGRINHAVLLIGYGSENGQDYWLVKNSWGTGWGMSGYIKVRRNFGSMCSIALVGYLVY